MPARTAKTAANLSASPISTFHGDLVLFTFLDELVVLEASRSPNQVKKITRISIATIGILSGLVKISKKLCQPLASSIS
jgi:hypothetical protein